MGSSIQHKAVFLKVLDSELGASNLTDKINEIGSEGWLLIDTQRLAATKGREEYVTKSNYMLFFVRSDND